MSHFLRAYWKRGAGDNASQRALAYAGMIGIAGALLLAWITLFCWLPKAPKAPDLRQARALFVISAAPSQALLKDLEAAHQKGVIVRLITSENIVGAYSITHVPRDKITQNGVLIDNISWYVLP